MLNQLKKFFRGQKSRAGQKAIAGEQQDHTETNLQTGSDSAPTVPGSELTLQKTPYQTNDLVFWPTPQLFAVNTWGCTATHWLAKNLDSHSEILCVHNFSSKLQFFADLRRLDGLQLMNLISHMGLPFRSAGDVHGLSRHLVPKLRDCLGNKFNALVVVREPLPRLLSAMGLFRKNHRLRVWDLSWAEHLIETHDLKLPSGNYREKLFVQGANMLNAIVEEREVGSIYCCEGLVSSPDMLGRFVDELTRGVIEPGRSWLEACLNSPRINVHSDPVDKETPFADWQIEVIRSVVSEQAWDLYQELGYRRPAFV